MCGRRGGGGSSMWYKIDIYLILQLGLNGRQLLSREIKAHVKSYKSDKIYTMYSTCILSLHVFYPLFIEKNFL